MTSRFGSGACTVSTTESSVFLEQLSVYFDDDEDAEDANSEISGGSTSRGKSSVRGVVQVMRGRSEFSLEYALPDSPCLSSSWLKGS